MTTIMWFRSDLRINDHPALGAATAQAWAYERSKRNTTSAYKNKHAATGVLCVYVKRAPLWGTPNWGQTAWGEQLPDLRRSELQERALHSALLQLKQSLGGNLLTLEGDPATALPLLARLIAKSTQNEGNISDIPVTVHVTDDFTPPGRTELERVAAALDKIGARLVSTGSPYMVDPGTIKTGEGGNYRVYTPFSRRWFTTPWLPPMNTNAEIMGADRTNVNTKDAKSTGNAHVTLRAVVGRTIAAKTISWDGPTEGTEVTAPALGKEDLQRAAQTDLVGMLAEAGITEIEPENASHDNDIWTTQISEKWALERLDNFLDEALEDYPDGRNMLAEDGTSRLSVQLTHGTIHPRTILRTLAETGDMNDKPRYKFAAEIAWREFYADYLHANPHTGWHDTNESFANFHWDTSREDDLQAWKDGNTGVPVIDAAMRQLRETGWMHNRARMLVASYLTKDLHLRWQVGAAYFLTQLVDADFASNQHSWQWTAGTGTDASPFFRIFNPYTQGAKFDPAAKYIRRWIPELAKVVSNQPLSAKQVKALHNAKGDLGVGKDSVGPLSDYPEPLVDHKAERADSLERYRDRQLKH